MLEFNNQALRGGTCNESALRVNINEALDRADLASCAVETGTVRGLPVKVALSTTVLPRRMETEDVGITVLHLLPPQLLLRADLNLKGQT